MQEQVNYNKKYNALYNYYVQQGNSHTPWRDLNDKNNYFVLLEKIELESHYTLKENGLATDDDLLFIHLRKSVKNFPRTNSESILENKVEEMITDQLDNKNIQTLNSNIAKIIFDFYKENYIKKSDTNNTQGKTFLQDLILKYLITQEKETIEISELKENIKKINGKLPFTLDDIMSLRMEKDEKFEKLYETTINLYNTSKKNHFYLNYIKAIYTLYKHPSTSDKTKDKLIKLTGMFLKLKQSKDKLVSNFKEKIQNIKQQISSIDRKSIFKKVAGVALITLAILIPSAFIVSIAIFAALVAPALPVAYLIAFLTLGPTLGTGAAIGLGILCDIYGERLYKQRAKTEGDKQIDEVVMHAKALVKQTDDEHKTECDTQITGTPEQYNPVLSTPQNGKPTTNLPTLGAGQQNTPKQPATT